MIRKMALMDWRAMKYYHVRGFIIPIFLILVGLFSSSLLIMPTSVIMFLFFSINPFAVEEKGALNNLYLTLPVSRAAIVSGRFLLAGILGLCGIVISIPLMLIVNRFGWTHYYMPFGWYIFILAFSYLFFSFFNLAVYPILFKLGYIKGKFWGMICPAILLGLLYGAFTIVTNIPGNKTVLIDVLSYAYEHMLLISGGIAVLATLLLALSFTLSNRIYKKREF